MSVALGSVLAAWHMPGDNPLWRGASGSASRGAGVARAYHFLAEDCGCSERIEQWLRSSRGRAGWPAVIVRRDRSGKWRGRTPEGAEVQDIPAGEGIQLAPWLIVSSATGETLYAGGYDKAPVHGDRILEELAQGGQPAKRGVRGCAVDAEARRATALLQWKEWWNRP